MLNPSSGSDSLKDRAGLLLAGIVAASLAWLFWSSLGEHAVAVFNALFIVGLATDHWRLRKTLKSIHHKA